MIIGTILPHTLLYGGVKRFLELGNRAVALGHRWILFTPEGKPPNWYSFRGEVQTLADLPGQKLDALFATENRYVEELVRADTDLRIFYHVKQNHSLDKILAIPKKIIVFANSTNIYEHDKRRYGIEPVKAVGAVDCALFSQGERQADSTDATTTIITYGRFYKKKKGTNLVVKACERLHRKGHRLKLILFDTPVKQKDRQRLTDFSCQLPFEFVIDHPVERNFELYKRADIFASAEKNAGWANTCAEAMASGLAVVATGSGAQDFLINRKTGLKVWRNSFSLEWALRRLIKSVELRKRLAEQGRQKIQQFDWQPLTERILDYIAKNKL